MCWARASPAFPGFRLARLEAHGDLLPGRARRRQTRRCREIPALTGPSGQALGSLLYLFERDEAVRLLRAG